MVGSVSACKKVASVSISSQWTVQSVWTVDPVAGVRGASHCRCSAVNDGLPLAVAKSDHRSLGTPYRWPRCRLRVFRLPHDVSSFTMYVGESLAEEWRLSLLAHCTVSHRFQEPATVLARQLALTSWKVAVETGPLQGPAALVRLRRATSLLQRAIPATQVPGLADFRRDRPGFQKVKEVAAGGIVVVLQSVPVLIVRLVLFPFYSYGCCTERHRPDTKQVLLSAFDRWPSGYTKIGQYSVRAFVCTCLCC